MTTVLDRQAGTPAATPSHRRTSFLAHSAFLTVRSLRALSRQPIYLAFTLIQPMIWLLLFGQLFKRLADLPGILVLVACAVLLGLAFAALSNAVALLVRQQEALIGVSQFLTMPLTFLSSVLMAPALMPNWVADVARFNPVDWAAVAAREALSSTPDWALIGRDLGLLLALMLVMGWLATRAFRTYQRSA